MGLSNRGAFNGPFLQFAGTAHLLSLDVRGVRTKKFNCFFSKLTSEYSQSLIKCQLETHSGERERDREKQSETVHTVLISINNESV